MPMIFCHGCGKEIHDSAISCPHCGAPQVSASAEMGKEKSKARKPFWVKALIVIFALLVFAIGKSSYQGYKREHPGANATTAQSDEFSELAAATPAQLSPAGELAAMFNLASDNTDLQRENKIKEIRKKIVEWTLPVYEVRPDGSGYAVQTLPDDESVGVIVYVTARNEQEKAVIEGLKTGSSISFKGMIDGVSMRSLKIKPAILFQRGSAKPLAIETQQLTPVAQALATAPAAPVQQVRTAEQAGLCNGLDMSVTPDQLECADREFKSVDKQLNGTYKQLMASLDGPQKAALKKEQISWVKEKETKCPQESEEAGGGQLGTVVAAHCNVFMTEQRLAYLKKYK